MGGVASDNKERSGLGRVSLRTALAILLYAAHRIPEKREYNTQNATVIKDYIAKCVKM